MSNCPECEEDDKCPNCHAEYAAFVKACGEMWDNDMEQLRKEAKENGKTDDSNN